MSCGAKLQPEWKFCGTCREPVPRDAAPGRPAIRETGTAPAADAASASDTGAAPASGTAAAPASGTAAVAEFSGPGGPGGPGASDTAEGFKKPSRKVIISVSVLLALAVAGIGAYFYIQNMIRGGAGSAESAADKLIEAVEDKDLTGFFTMLPPQERDALQRVQEAAEEQAEEHGILDAAAKVSDGDAGSGDEDGMDLSLDGIDISLGGAEPVVTEIDEHLAMIKFSSGELRVQIDPAQTTGAIRSAFEAGGDMDPIDESTPFASLGINNSGLTLMATETQGRWYISPLYSGLEFAQQFTGSSRGNVPGQPAPGSDSAADAARNAVAVLPQMVSNGSVMPLAPYLSGYEGNALYYYGGLIDSVLGGSGSDEFYLGEVAFRDGGKDGNRTKAVVENITVETEYGDRFNLTSNCIMEDGDEQMCANGSGYGLRYGGSPEPDGLSLLNSSTEWSLTTVKEDGKHKVSILDSAADWAAGWVRSLTREQALALMDLARSEDPSGDMAVGEESDVAFNSAGYAVKTLTVEEKQRVEFQGNYGKVHVYPAGSGARLATLGGNADPKELEPGDYKLVIFAGNDWSDKFAGDGSGVQYSEPVTARKYISPPRIDGSDYAYSDSIYTESNRYSTNEVQLEVPEGNDVELVVTITDLYTSSSSTSGSLILTLDGNRYQVPVNGGDAEQVIPYPADSEAETLGLELDMGGKYGSVSYSLEFVRK
ncbi:hypothetical protein OL239_16550 [Arthrobacter sp. ATA002]|uniref:hypothetical protein n=1 Tax=Arthrobacter sp. ATA002 TaxID=2991715 RepID=UPI0022A7503B|nr:hypothetical protein [Arthrobacter sp. ATA002]WAP51412.1 hypothetical protein OL239_16550 [Arthrobacter sp. ATA002]